MQINSYKISTNLKIATCTYQEAMAGISNGDEKFWMDILDAGRSEIEPMLDALNVKGMLRMFCLDAGDHPGFYPLSPYVLVVLPVQQKVQEKNGVSYMTILIGEKFLFTIRPSGMARFKKEILFEDASEVLPDETPVGALSALMLGLSLECLRSTSKLAGVISEMESNWDKGAHMLNGDELSDRRSEIMVLESIVSGQLPVLNIIAGSEKKMDIRQTSREYLRWTIANLQAADKKLEWLERRADLMRSAIDMHAQETINKRLNRLTILSMIFMPVTFLAGVWGMNFPDMPLLNNEFGYWTAMIIMVLVTGAMYLFFRMKKWFQ